MNYKDFDQEQYYNIFAGGELYCKMVLPKEFDIIIPMAVKRVSSDIKVEPVIEFISGFDTYITTILV